MKKLLITGLALINLLPIFASAEVATLSKVRVFYRPDGGVSILKAVADACGGLSETECLDRETQKGNLKNLPYDDISEDQLPKDRESRDKWRGEKGKGISIDKSLVTKSEKIKELQDKLDAELDKNNPNGNKIANLQVKIEKLKKLKTENNLLSAKQIAQFKDSNNSSLLASAAGAISEAVAGVLDSIKEGILALKQLATDTLKVGSSEKPAGITIYDLANNKPYCLIVKDGQLQNIPGECGASVSKESLSVGVSTSTGTPLDETVATSTLNVSASTTVTQSTTSSSTATTTTE